MTSHLFQKYKSNIPLCVCNSIAYGKAIRGIFENPIIESVCMKKTFRQIKILLQISNLQ